MLSRQQLGEAQADPGRPQVRVKRRMDMEWGVQRAIGCWLTGLTLLGPDIAHADDTSAQRNRDDEILVTARRREERIQDVPIAVSAYAGDAIAARNAVSLSEIANFAPNTVFDSTAPISGSANAASVFIRGVGQTDFTISSDSGVAIYIDGVNLSRSIGAVADMFDVDRVEVLRGPQGTLFGRNAVGGAISVTHASPRIGVSQAEAELIAASFDRREAKAIANIPLGDDLAIRVGGVHRKRDGYVKRLLTGKTLGGLDNYALRASLGWKPDKSAELTLSFDYTKADEEPSASAIFSGSREATIGAPQTLFAGLLYNNLIPGPDGMAPCQHPDFIIPFCGLPGIIELPPLPPGTLPFDQRWLTNNPRQTFATGPRRSAHQIAAVTATASFEIGGLRFKSITGYRRLHAEFGRDPDNSPLALIETTNDIRHHQFSEELQLNGSSRRLSWIAGLYYLAESGSDGVTANFAEETFSRLREAGLGCTLYPALTGAPSPVFLPVCPNIFAIGYLGRGITAHANSFALFGEANLEFRPGLTLTVGGRWTRDRKRIDVSNYTAGGVQVATEPRASQSWSEFTPRLVLDWRFGNDRLLYLSWSSGYKAGGFNQRYGLPIAAPTSYKPERVQNLELGLKGALLDGRLQLNIAAFRARYQDIQVVVFDNGIPRITNAALGRIQGIEIEGRLMPLDGVTMEFAYGWLKARYTRLDPAIIGSFGSPIVNPLRLDYAFVDSPHHSLALGVSYKHGLRNAASLTFRADVRHRSRSANDSINTPELMQPRVTLLNANLAYTSSRDRWTIACFGANLTNRRYITSGVADEPGFGIGELSTARPRELGLVLKVRL